MVINSHDEFSGYISSFVKDELGVIEITNKEKLLSEGIDTLAYTAALSEDSATRFNAKVLIRKIAPLMGVKSASIYELYKAIGRGEVSGFSVPAMNIRMMAYDFSQVIFEEAIKREAGAFILELARHEMDYCDQRPDEFSASVLAAAIKSGFQGPVFIQGDHFQFTKNVWEKNPQEEIDNIELLIKDSLMAHIYNIDIDASTLVDLAKEDLSEQQRDNYEMTAEIIKYIRNLERGVKVSIGGEIGHIGGKNSTVEDFTAFMDGLMPLIGDMEGVAKVSVQTGTSHGGMPDANGKVIAPTIDFSVLRDISKTAREKYQIAGTVQHGASTLPESEFEQFPKNDTVEVHLSTEFQNIIMENLPAELREKIHAWVMENLENEREKDWNDTQFIYKMRKKAVGKFKRECWELSSDDKEKVKKALAGKVGFLFDAFNIIGTAHTVRKYISGNF